MVLENNLKIEKIDEFTSKLIIYNLFELTLDSKFCEKLLNKLTSNPEFFREKIYDLLRDYSGKIKNIYTERPFWFVEDVPLIGYNAFGIIDRGTNILQVRPITGCNLNCIFCSVDEGRYSRTRVNDFIVKLEDLIYWYKKVAEIKKYTVEAHIDGQGEPTLYPWFVDLVFSLAEIDKTRLVSFQTNGTKLTEELIYELTESPKPVRVNLSLNTLDPLLAIKIHNGEIDLQKILEILELLIDLKKQGKIDVLIAPIYLPGINDSDMIKIIEKYAVEKNVLVLIQKFEKYKLGRIPKLKYYQTWKEFYDWLSSLERKYKVELILRWEKMFNRKKDVRYPIKLDRKIIEIRFPGRTKNEYIGIIDNKYLIMVYTFKRLKIGEKIRAKKVFLNDSILYTYYD